MLAAMVVAKSVGSCDTSPSCARRNLMLSAAMLCPSSRICPDPTS